MLPEDSGLPVFLNHWGVPCAPHSCLQHLLLGEAGLLSLRVDSQRCIDPGPLSWRVIQPTNYRKLKPGNLNPSAGCLTTNHLLAHPELDPVTPPVPAWLHYHGHGKGGNQEVTGSSVSALSLAWLLPWSSLPGDF